MRKIFEGLALLASAGIAVKWVLDPDGPYEPIIVLIGTSLAVYSHYFKGDRTTSSLQVVENDQEKPKQELIDSKTESAELPRFDWGSSADFFGARFASAFPGLRSTAWFTGQSAVDRLSLLLKSPLVFSNKGGTVSPIWWFGRGNLQVEAYARIDAKTVLINFDEYSISRIAAVYSYDYRRLWVYVEVEPMQPTGLYPNTPIFLSEAAKENRTYCEEYAIFDGKHKITRSEYDDGHADIGGTIVPTSGKAELRVRQLRPYNFVLCSHGSPINSIDFDEILERFLDEMLVDPTVFDKYASFIEKLPAQRDS